MFFDNVYFSHLFPQIGGSIWDDAESNIFVSEHLQVARETISTLEPFALTPNKPSVARACVDNNFMYPGLHLQIDFYFFFDENANPRWAVLSMEMSERVKNYFLTK